MCRVRRRLTLWKTIMGRERLDCFQGGDAVLPAEQIRLRPGQGRRRRIGAIDGQGTRLTGEEGDT